MLVGDEGQAIVEDAEFVCEGVVFGGGDGGVMEFAGQGGDAAGEGNPGSGGQNFRYGYTGNATLKPHVPVGDDAEGFGDGAAIETVCCPAGIPEGLLDVVAVPVGAFSTNFPQDAERAV